MNTKNVSFFLIMLLFPLESSAMTSIAQRLGPRTSKVISHTPYQRIPLTQPKRFFGFQSWLSKKLNWNGWFNRPNTQQYRYFSSKKNSPTDVILLFKTVQSGSKEKLYELIKKGLVDINARYDNNETILHIAVDSGASDDIITLLIDVGADLHAKDRYGYTPLHNAALLDNVKAVKLLVAKGANPNTTNTVDEANEGAFASVQQFFGNFLPKSSSEDKTPKGKSPLYLAQEQNRPSKKTLEIIQFLEPLTTKALWLVITPERALQRAMLFNQVATIKRLCAEHAFAKDSLNTVLLDGADESNVTAETLAELIDVGADVNVHDVLGRTPLHYAARSSNLEIVKLLLGRGANPNMRTSTGKSPLDLAKELDWPTKNTLEIIKILEPLTYTPKKQFGTSMNLENELLLLKKAIRSNNAVSVKQVLAEHTFSKNALNIALIEASEGSFAARAEMLAALIDMGADINTCDDSLKRTPLHNAAHYSNLEAARLLLNRKANPNALDYEKKSPLYLAQEKDKQSQETIAIIKLLEPVTKTSLWFVITPEIMLRRAVKANEEREVRSVLEREEKPPVSKKEETKESTKHTKKRAKKFTVGNIEELMNAWENALNKKSVYEILGLDRGSSEEEINEAYMDWTRSHHPDVYRDEVLNKQANTVLQYLNRHLR